MNLVLDEAEEVSIKKKTRKPLGLSLFRYLEFLCSYFHVYLGWFSKLKFCIFSGRILLKGDNITLMMNAYVTCSILLTLN